VEVAIPSIQVGFSIPDKDWVASNPVLQSQSLLFRSVFPLSDCSGHRGWRSVESQSLLFRSVFPLETSTQFKARCLLSQSLLFRSVFPLGMRRILVWALRRSRNPFYSGRFFHFKAGMRYHGVQVVCRNPFYSGRFFHWIMKKETMKKEREGSQSLLFRSVFPLVVVTEPQIVVPKSRNPFYSGRFFHCRSLTPSKDWIKESQSLLFRSVFPFPAQRTMKGP